MAIRKRSVNYAADYGVMISENTLGDIQAFFLVDSAGNSVSIGSSALPSTPSFSQTTIADNTATDALASNTSRRQGFLINNTAATFWIKEGADAVLNKGFKLFPGEYYKILTTARISVIQNSGGPVDLETVQVT